MLTKDQVKAIKTLLSIDKNFIFGGSLSLYAYGLLDREIGDLDVFCESTDLRKIKSNINISFDRKSDYGFTTEFNGEVLERLPLFVNGVKVCIFKVPKYLLPSSELDVSGIEVKVQNPCFAIAGKVLFSKHDPKHIKDLEDIRVKLVMSNLL